MTSLSLSYAAPWTSLASNFKSVLLQILLGATTTPFPIPHFPTLPQTESQFGDG